GVGVRLRAGFAEPPRRPQAQELVAPGGRLEAQVLVVDELSLESLFAFVEGRHRLRSLSFGRTRPDITGKRNGRQPRRPHAGRARAALDSSLSSAQGPGRNRSGPSCAETGDRLGCPPAGGRAFRTSSTAPALAADLFLEPR